LQIGWGNKCQNLSRIRENPKQTATSSGRVLDDCRTDLLWDWPVQHQTAVLFKESGLKTEKSEVTLKRRKIEIYVHRSTSKLPVFTLRHALSISSVSKESG